MTAHELMGLERGDQVRIRGNPQIFIVRDKAVVLSRNESGYKASSIRLTPFGRTVPFDVPGFQVIRPDMKGRFHKHPVSLKRGRMD